MEACICVMQLGDLQSRGGIWADLETAGPRDLEAESGGEVLLGGSGMDEDRA